MAAETQQTNTQDAPVTLEELQREVIRFRDDRNWKQFHNPKDLAISISLEAAELLEIFQWSGTDLEAADKRDKIAEELADILNYCLLLADVTGLDPAGIILDKIRVNDAKYPVEQAYGNKAKYTELKAERRKAEEMG